MVNLENSGGGGGSSGGGGVNKKQMQTKTNIPETLVKNRMALEHYCAIKNDGARQDTDSLESTSLH